MNLNQVTLPTRDVARGAAFYRKLGLTQIVAAPHYARFTLPGGDATLSLHLAEKTGHTGVEVGLECEDLDAEVARLRAAGIELEHDPVDQTWLWREARVRDPDGNVLLLFHAGAARRDPPWKLPPGYTGQ